MTLHERVDCKQFLESNATIDVLCDLVWEIGDKGKLEIKTNKLNVTKLLEEKLKGNLQDREFSIIKIVPTRYCNPTNNTLKVSCSNNREFDQYHILGGDNLQRCFAFLVSRGSGVIRNTVLVQEDILNVSGIDSWVEEFVTSYEGGIIVEEAKAYNKKKSSYVNYFTENLKNAAKLDKIKILQDLQSFWSTETYENTLTYNLKWDEIQKNLKGKQNFLLRLLFSYPDKEVPRLNTKFKNQDSNPKVNGEKFQDLAKNVEQMIQQFKNEYEIQNNTKEAFVKFKAEIFGLIPRKVQYVNSGITTLQILITYKLKSVSEK